MKTDEKKQSFTELINGDKPVLVDFYADWYEPCKMIPSSHPFQNHAVQFITHGRGRRLLQTPQPASRKATLSYPQKRHSG